MKKLFPVWVSAKITLSVANCMWAGDRGVYETIG